MNAPHRPAGDDAVLEVLRELQQPDGPDVLTELINLFLDDTPKRLAALRDDVCGGDAHQATARAAHALKGSAGNIGAAPFAELCANVERVAKHGQTDGIDLTPLEDEYARVEAALRSA